MVLLCNLSEVVFVGGLHNVEVIIKTVAVVEAAVEVVIFMSSDHLLADMEVIMILEGNQAWDLRWAEEKREYETIIETLSTFKIINPT